MITSFLFYQNKTSFFPKPYSNLFQLQTTIFQNHFCSKLIIVSYTKYLKYLDSHPVQYYTLMYIQWYTQYTLTAQVSEHCGNGSSGTSVEPCSKQQLYQRYHRTGRLPLPAINIPQQLPSATSQNKDICVWILCLLRWRSFVTGRLSLISQPLWRYGGERPSQFWFQLRGRLGTFENARAPIGRSFVHVYVNSVER